MQSHLSRRQFLQITVSSAVGLSLSSVAHVSANTLSNTKISTERPSGLMVSLMEQALGIRPEQLRLSWLVPELNTSTQQYAYQVQFALTQKALLASKNLIWDSGTLKKSDSIAVPCSGELSLEPDQVYYWRVRVWSDDNTLSQWSEPDKIVTAISTNQWLAQPIWSANATDQDDNWLLARKPFQLNAGEVEAAWVRVTAQSPETARQYVYRLWLNGALVGLGPVRAMGDEARYHTYDVTLLLNQGENALAALCYSANDRSLLVELVVQFTNGQRQIVPTNTSWKTLSGNKWRPFKGFITQHYYQAPNEYIDARKEPVGWTDIGFNDVHWQPASVQPSLTSIEPAWVDPMQISYLKPKSIEQLKPGHWVLDFGKEVVGGIHLDVDGKAEQKVEVRLGEELNEDGSVRYKLRSYPVYQEIWILRDGPQQLEHWGYRAFRWAEIVTSPDTDVSKGISASVLKMPWDDTQASFDSSDSDLNQVWELCRYSIEATRQDLYQDTPTRERGAYEGDAIINQLSEYASQRSYALARYSSSFLVRRSTWPTEYRLQTALLAWQDYLHTGDDSNLEADYSHIVNLQLLNNLNAEGFLEKDPGKSSHANGDLVDWPKTNRDGFEFTPINTVINAWQYAALVTLANIAEVLGKHDDKQRFKTLASKLRNAVNTKLLSSTYRYRDGLDSQHHSQHATAFALGLGLTAKSDIAQVGAALRLDIEQRGMQVSVYGSQFLLNALYAAGEGITAHDVLVSRNQFSWLHMIEQWQATIVMEAWDPAIKPNATFSHAWGSAPANCIQRHIAGVQIAEPGAARILIAPQPGRLKWFNAKVPTIRGAVEVNFNRHDESLLTLRLPPNVNGDLALDLGQVIAEKSIAQYVVEVSNHNHKAIRYTMKKRLLTVNQLKPGMTLVKLRKLNG